jgi:hypothetical protein
VLKVEQVAEVSVQPAHHCIAVLPPTVIVPAVLTTTTAEQFVIISPAFGLLVPMVARLIVAVDSPVPRFWDAKVRVFVQLHYT